MNIVQVFGQTGLTGKINMKKEFLLVPIKMVAQTKKKLEDRKVNGVNFHQVIY